MAVMLLERHATVTIAHSRTRDLAAEVARAEIVVAAIGKAELVRGEWIREGAVVIDVGMNRLERRQARRRRGVRRRRAARLGDHAGAGRRRADDPRDAARQHDRARALAPAMTRAALAAALVALAVVAACTAAPSPTFTVRSERAPPPRARAGDRGPVPARPPPRRLRRSDRAAGRGRPRRRRGPPYAPVRARARPWRQRLPVRARTRPSPGADACRFAADGNTLAGGFEPPRGLRVRAARRTASPLAEPPAAEVYLSLGNHDVATWSDCRASDDPVAEGRLKACLELAHRSPVWRMPARHYVVERGAARFLIVDTNLVEQQYGGFALDDEVAFVARGARCRPDAAKTSRAAATSRGASSSATTRRPRLACTAGTRRRSSSPERTGSSRLAAGGSRRCSQATTTISSTSARRRGSTCSCPGTRAGARVASGSRRRRSPGTAVLFATVRWGYGVLEVARDGWRYRFEGDGGAPLYCCAATGAGACAPSVCPGRTNFALRTTGARARSGAPEAAASRLAEPRGSGSAKGASLRDSSAGSALDPRFDPDRIPALPGPEAPHVPTHAPLRRSRPSWRAHGRVRRLGDAGPVRRHPRGARRRSARAPASSTSRTWARSCSAARGRSRRCNRLFTNDLVEDRRRPGAVRLPLPRDRRHRRTTSSSTASAPSDLLVCVNAGNRRRTSSGSPATPAARTSRNESDAWAQLALQGPQAAAHPPAAHDARPLARSATYRFTQGDVAGVPLHRRPHRLHRRGRLRAVLPARRGAASSGTRSLEARQARRDPPAAASARATRCGSRWATALRQRHRRRPPRRSRRGSAGS